MKMLISGLAAAFMATAALAQTPPADPMANNPAATPSATPAPATDAAPPAAEAGANAPMLVEKDGKWWNGERPATKAEIAEHQRKHPQ